jgi:hypothetical protein
VIDSVPQIQNHMHGQMGSLKLDQYRSPILAIEEDFI